MTLLEKIALKILLRRFAWLDIKKLKGKDEVEAITLSMTEDYIKKISKIK